MAQISHVIQEKMKNSSLHFGIGILRLFSGMILGLTFALIADEILKLGVVSFLFIIVSVTYAFMKISKSWRLMNVVVFDLVCVLLGMLIRLYILTAPGE